MHVELTNSTTCSVSQQLPMVTLQITLHVDILEEGTKDFGGVAITMDPPLLPEEVHELAFFQAVSNGVHTALAQTLSQYPQGGITITVSDLRTSVNAHTLSEADWQLLAECLEQLTNTTLSQILSPP